MRPRPPSPTALDSAPAPARWLRAIACAACCAWLAACTPQPPFAQLSGLLLDSQLSEISGIAASHRHEDVLYVANDGGNA
ncbi:MAG TPA: hypothetical protein VL118_01435, partial [Luteimonas sp.]|nr:hypothetical protein [Luteimonas sp.]